MKFVIRVDGSSNIGMGHLNRSSILAEALISLGQEAVLLISDNKEAACFLDRTSATYYAVNDAAEWPEADVCIVDLYQYNDEYYARIKEKYKFLIIFDDNKFYVPQAVSIVINNNLYADSSYYPREIQSFTGSEYYMLRGEFIGKSRRKDASHVLVCMGGSDPEGQTRRIARIIESITKYKVDLIFGQAEDADKFLYKFISLPNVNIYSAVGEMSSFMERAAYCICGAGSMVYELAYMGVPIACLSLADNQRLIGKTLSDKNLALYLGHFSEITDNEIFNALTAFAENKLMREAMAKKFAGAIDGLGAKRLALHIMEWMKRE